MSSSIIVGKICTGILLFWCVFYLNLNILTTQPSSTKNHNYIFGYIVVILIISFFETIIITGGLLVLFNYIKRQYDKLYRKWVNYKKEKKFATEIEMTGDPVDCCICLDNMEKGIKLKCNHVIHKKCLHNMISYDINKCPLCCKEFV
jgi:hypothetical protein